MTHPLANAYGGAADPTARKQESAARSFRHDAQLEEVAAMKRERPEEFARLSPALKIALGYYESA
jgi:hypothetical protein